AHAGKGELARRHQVQLGDLFQVRGHRARGARAEGAIGAVHRGAAPHRQDAGSRSVDGVLHGPGRPLPGADAGGAPGLRAGTVNADGGLDRRVRRTLEIDRFAARLSGRSGREGAVPEMKVVPETKALPEITEAPACAGASQHGCWKTYFFLAAFFFAFLAF